jgi:hypothetical protein
MTNQRTIMHRLAKCPKCSLEHEYTLRIESTSSGANVGSPAQPALVFGGPKAVKQDVRTWDVSLTCPTTLHPFIEPIQVPVLSGEALISVEQAQAAPTTPDWSSTEFAEWIKTSIASERDFCKTMLSTVSAAIPVYFAILKYLGLNRVQRGWQAMSAAPPVLLFASMLAFSVALRPSGRTIRSIDEFALFRSQRLTRMSYAMSAGLALFAAALLCSVIVWLAILW